MPLLTGTHLQTRYISTIAIAGVVTALVAPIARAAGPRYFVTPLVPAGSGSTRFSVADLNDYGQTVGWAEGSTSATSTAQLWSPSTPNGRTVTAKALPARSTKAQALNINNGGQVLLREDLPQVSFPGRTYSAGSVWSPSVPRGSVGTALALPGLQADKGFHIVDLTDAGFVVGDAYTDGTEYGTGWVRRPDGSAYDIHILRSTTGAAGGTAFARNETGRTLVRLSNDWDGVSDPSAGPASITGTVTRLGLQPMAAGAQVTVEDVNNGGAITGTLRPTGTFGRAAVFDRVSNAWQATTVGPVPASNEATSGVGINDAGDVLGTYAVVVTEQFQPFVYHAADGTTTLLNAALESTSGRGWSFRMGTAINNRGQVVLNGRFDHDNNSATAPLDRPALLTPGKLGDANFDFAVNFADLVTLAQNYNKPTNQTWLTGDFTGDGAVNFADLVALAQNYGKSQTAFTSDWALAQSVVPEPAIAAVLLPPGFGLMRRTRRQ